MKKIEEIAKNLAAVMESLKEIGSYDTVWTTDGQIEVQVRSLDKFPQQRVSLTKRDDSEYPLEKAVVVEGIRFYQLLDAEKAQKEIKKMIA